MKKEVKEMPSLKHLLEDLKEIDCRRFGILNPYDRHLLAFFQFRE